MRVWLGLVGLLGSAVMTCSAAAQTINAALVPEPTAARHELTRAWYGQVDIDRARSKLQGISLQRGLLIAHSDQGHVQVFDAETGKSLWSVEVGSRTYPTLAPAANDAVVAVVNGSTLYLYDRTTGGPLGKRVLSGAPIAPPTVGAEAVYIPLARELVEEQVIDEAKKFPVRKFSAVGKANMAPLVTKESIVWTTSKGSITAIDPSSGNQRFREDLFGKVDASATYMPPLVFVGTTGGYVYAIHETKGRTSWRFTAGEPVQQSPVAIKDAVYVISESGTLFRLKMDDGAEVWHAPYVKQFLAATPKRLYIADLADRVVILDAASGARIDTLPVSGFPIKITNVETDRLYLATAGGLLQCLRDVSLKTALAYAPQLPSATVKGKPTEKSAPAKTAEPAAKAPAVAPPGDRIPSPVDRPVAPKGDDPFAGAAPAPRPAPMTLPPSSGANVASAVDLSKAYTLDRAKADALYLNKTITVEGKVKRSVEEGGILMVSLEGFSEAGEPPSPVNFQMKAGTQAGAFRVGATVRLRAKVTGASSLAGATSVFLEEAELVR